MPLSNRLLFWRNFLLVTYDRIISHILSYPGTYIESQSSNYKVSPKEVITWIPFSNSLFSSSNKAPPFQNAQKQISVHPHRPNRVRLCLSDKCNIFQCISHIYKKVCSPHPHLKALPEWNPVPSVHYSAIIHTLWMKPNCLCSRVNFLWTISKSEIPI